MEKSAEGCSQIAKYKKLAHQGGHDLTRKQAEEPKKEKQPTLGNQPDTRYHHYKKYKS
jgi:hypothetical protein